MSRGSTFTRSPQEKNARNSRFGVEKIHGHTSVRTDFVQDSRLSYETRGMLLRLFGEGTRETTVAHILASGNTGRDKIYRMLKEAETYGYVRPARPHLTGGKFGQKTYVLTDNPNEIPSGDDAQQDTFLYVMTAADLIKVGVSKNPDQRMHALNSCSQERMSMDFVCRMSARNAAVVERAVHKHLEEFCVRGEWFRCTAEAAIKAVQHIQSRLAGEDRK